MIHYRRLILMILIIVPSILYAKKLRIVIPYIGTIDNHLLIESVPQELDDSALMGGIYFQCVNPDRYQWNVFFYYSDKINQSGLIGSHFIFDYYIRSTERGKSAVGIGLDFIRINTESEDFAGLRDFRMTNNIYAPYVRMGHYFLFGGETHRFQIFPWGGFERDMLNGDLSFIPPFGPPLEIDLDEDYNYGLLGITLDAVFFHFFEIKLKVHQKIDLDRDKSMNYITLMTNVFLSRKWGVSYRFKSMEEVIGDNQYHLWGIGYIF